MNFNDKMRVAIFGSSGGIGSALVDQLGNDPRVARLYPISRTKTCSETLILNYDDEKTISAAAELIKADGPLDLVIVASGLLHDSNGLLPEKTFRSLESASLEKLYRVNVIGPALVAKHFIPLLSPDRKNVFATLGARVGSITDNNLGGWYSYRASKSALNQLIKTASIEFKRKKSNIIFLSLHPGTVDTKLSKPFSNKKKLFTTSLAAKKILKTLNNASAEQSGSLIDYDGNIIPF